MDIHETLLPGVGVRHEFTTQSGVQMGVISHHSGRHNVVVYDLDDPDSSHEVVSLTADESENVAELLGAARITSGLGQLQQRIEGLSIEWLTLAAASPYVGRPLGDTRARTRTGVSIVAAIRGDQAFPAPEPPFLLAAGDVLVVVGTPAGVNALGPLLATG